MKTLFGIEVTDEEFDELFCEQANGKELKVVDGKVVAVEHEATERELLEDELRQLELWFNEYDNQVKQYQRCIRLGVEFDKDINELDTQAQTNQLRIREIRLILLGE